MYSCFLWARANFFKNIDINSTYLLNIFAAEDAFCGTPVNAIRTSNTAVRGAEDEFVCCKDSNIAPGYIKPETDNANDFDKCSDFKSEGYRYEKLGEVACFFDQNSGQKSDRNSLLELSTMLGIARCCLPLRPEFRQ